MACPTVSSAYGRAQWAMFFANPKLRKYAKREAHKVIAERGKKTGYHSLPARKGIRKRV